MTVKELINILQTYPPETVVMTSVNCGPETTDVTMEPYVERHEIGLKKFPGIDYTPSPYHVPVAVLDITAEPEYDTGLYMGMAKEDEPEP